MRASLPLELTQNPDFLRNLDKIYPITAGDKPTWRFWNGCQVQIVHMLVNELFHLDHSYSDYTKNWMSNLFQYAAIAFAIQYNSYQRNIFNNVTLNWEHKILHNIIVTIEFLINGIIL